MEQKLEGFFDEERRGQLQLLSKPIVDDYYIRLLTIFKSTDKLKKAITFFPNQQEYMCAFLEHGENENSNHVFESLCDTINEHIHDMIKSIPFSQ